jgi:hypothetical protein
LRDLNYLVTLKSEQETLYGNVDESEIITDVVSIKSENLADEQTLELGLVLGNDDNVELINLGTFRF